MASKGEKYKALHDFLTDSFSLFDLKVFLRFNEYEEVVDAVNWQAGVSESTLSVVEAMDQRGLVDVAFFERLSGARPAKRVEVEALQRVWFGGTPVGPEPPAGTTQPKAGQASPPHPSMGRPTLVRGLAVLTPADFEMLVASVPDAAWHVSRHVTIPEKAAELVRWAEGPTGPGLAAVEEAFEGLRNPL
jgi:hypothetical protein